MIGGPIESISIAGRLFAVAADAEVNRKLGGFENETESNGDGTARVIKTRVPWGLDGLSISVDDANDDQEFLQDIADKNGNSVIVVTFASGSVYQGLGSIVGEMQFSNLKSTAPISLMGPGVLTKQ